MEEVISGLLSVLHSCACAIHLIGAQLLPGGDGDLDALGRTSNEIHNSHRYRSAFIPQRAQPPAPHGMVDSLNMINAGQAAGGVDSKKTARLIAEQASRAIHAHVDPAPRSAERASPMTRMSRR